MYKSYVVEENKLIPITSKSQVHVGSIVAISDGSTTIFYRIVRLLPDKYIDNWIPKRLSISSFYVLNNKYLSPYFISNNELTGWLSHAWHGITHGVEHVAHEVGHGVEHVVHEVKVHPILLAVPATSAAIAIPGAIPAIGHAIGSVGSAIGVGSIAKAAATTVAANLASSLISKPPQQVVSEGAEELGLPQQQAQQIMQETDQYAQQNNIPQNVPYQQTLSYVASHWGYFMEHGFKSPQAAAVYILMKRHGVPPSPNDDPSTVTEAGIGGEIEKYLPYIAIVAIGILLLLPPEKRPKPEIIFLGGLKNAKQQS